MKSPMDIRVVVLVIIPQRLETGRGFCEVAALSK